VLGLPSGSDKELVLNVDEVFAVLDDFAVGILDRMLFPVSTGSARRTFLSN
jgi:hypothetical protein